MWHVATRVQTSSLLISAVKMPTINKSKRNFLKIFLKTLPVVWGGIMVWAVKNYFTFRPQKVETQVGLYNDYQQGSITHKKSERFFIICDSQGLYVISDICTHMGCRVQSIDNALKCPCHKSVFDLAGRPIEGPAKKDLDHYFITKNSDGVLVVNTTQLVSNEYRYTEY